MARHNNNLLNWKVNGRKLYRSKEDRINLERTDKGSWFRKAGATATIMVPVTPCSTLAKNIREVLKQHQGPRGTTTKVVERPGMAIHSSISSKQSLPKRKL